MVSLFSCYLIQLQSLQDFPYCHALLRGYGQLIILLPYSSILNAGFPLASHITSILFSCSGLVTSNSSYPSSTRVSFTTFSLPGPEVYMSFGNMNLSKLEKMAKESLRTYQELLDFLKYYRFSVGFCSSIFWRPNQLYCGWDPRRNHGSLLLDPFHVFCTQ